MLDIKFIRENPDAVRENIKKKFQDAKLPLVDEVLDLDSKRRAAIAEADQLRSNRNTLSKQIGMLMGQAKKDPAKLAEAEAVKQQVKEQADRLAELEKQETALEEKLPCTVQEDGALVFGAKMLAEMLSRLPQDTVQLCRAENQGRMTLRSGDACYEVDVWERGAFPKPDLPFPEDTVKLSGIPAMAQHTVFATAQDNSKPLLKCVNLMFTSTGLRAAGSNGNCIVTARGDNQSTGDVSLLIPAASLGKLSNMCQDKDEFRVGTTGKSIVFFRENFLFSARLMEGGYIDTDQLVGSIRNAFTVLTDIHDMRAALSSVLSIGTGNRVKLSFQDQRLVFQCAGDCVSASAPIEVIALTGTPAGDYWFNAKQLVTCLKALSGTVTLGIAQGGMLTLATQDAYYLQNAMRPEAQKKTQKAAQPAAAKAA